MTKVDFEKIYKQYMADVLSNKVEACDLVKKAVIRQQKDLKRFCKKGSLYFFDPKEGAKACKFLSLLTHTKGVLAGQPIKLEPWQVYNVMVIFGWRRTADNGRRFRRVYIEVPRGNGKSILSSGVALYCLLADGEPGADVYSFATTRDQAKIVFNDAQQMVRLNQPLREKFGVEVLANALYVKATNSTFQAKSADGSTLDGLNIHFACIDELHAHKTREVYDVVETGMGKRPNSLLWVITTAGFNISGVCYELHSMVLKVLNEDVVDDAQYGIVYTIDEGDDWTQESVAKKANPNWGVSVMPDVVMGLVAKAMTIPSTQNNIKTKHFDVWCNASSAWLDMEAWKACVDTTMTLEDFEGEPCYIGLDLASKNDITAKVRLFVRADEEGKNQFYIFPEYYLPRSAVQNSKNAQYEGWETLGYLTVTEGAVVDYEQIKEGLCDDLRRFDVKAIGYDPWNATQLALELSNQGAPMVEFRQTISKLSDPMKWLEALVADGRFHHQDNEATNWQMSNVVARTDRNDNIFPEKESYANKIDGAVATIIALGVSMGEIEDNSDAFVGWDSDEPLEGFSW